jgi:hypothetical protein
MTSEKAIGDLPTFARKNPPTDGTPLRVINYWDPDKTGVAEVDYEWGSRYLREAISFSLRHESSLFLACVLIEMFGRVGSMEAGFIDALLDRVEHGAIPEPLSEDELRETTGSAHDLEFRKLESEARSTIEFSKGWGPDALYIFTMSCLTGREGPNIAGAMTMIVRTALNGSRN